MAGSKKAERNPVIRLGSIPPKVGGFHLLTVAGVWRLCFRTASEVWKVWADENGTDSRCKPVAAEATSVAVARPVRRRTGCGAGADYLLVARGGQQQGIGARVAARDRAACHFPDRLCPGIVGRAPAGSAPGGQVQVALPGLAVAAPNGTRESPGSVS